MVELGIISTINIRFFFCIESHVQNSSFFHPDMSDDWTLSMKLTVTQI